MTTTPKHLVRSSAIPKQATLHIRHPLNPLSDVQMTQLGDLTGLVRVGVNLARIPPGRESFLPHAHAVQEEWVYVVRGRGQALLGEAWHDIAPGDFLGFPTDGLVHHIRNNGEEDLVLLQGGERGPIELASFPTINKRMLVSGGQYAQFVPESAVESMPFSAWLAHDSDAPQDG